MDVAGMRCLVVDDEPRVRSVVVRILAGEGLACREAGSAAEALRMLSGEPFDLAVLDIHMPEMDGTQLLAEIRSRWPDTGVVMITAVTDVRTAVGCLKQGALDYLGKPFQVEEVQARIRQSLERRRLVLENRDYQLHLEHRVREQAMRIAELFLEAVQSLAHALEAKDRYTRGHSARVAVYGVRIAEALGLDAPTTAELRLAGELHDIGKIGVRETVLQKPGKLTREEYLHVMEHTVIGERILSPLLRDHPLALTVARSHHERLDGAGLPDGLRGDDIPLAARITSVADAFDAITTGRPYIASRSTCQAVDELQHNRGRQFDPDCVDAFLAAYPEAARLGLGSPADADPPAPGAAG